MGFLKRLFGARDEEEALSEETPSPATDEFDELPGEAPAPPGREPLFRIEVDRQACTGMAECIRIAPEVFMLDEENIAVVVDASASTRADLLQAARECPTQAIKLYELDGRQIYPDWM